MATGLKNFIIRSSGRKLIEEIGDKLASNTSFAQGDILILDTSTHQVRKPTLETEGNLLIGVATVAVSNGKLVGPYAGLTDVDAAVAGGGVPGPEHSGDYKVQVKTGDSVNVGDALYFDPATGSRGVTVTAGTKIIGFALESITSAPAGSEILAKIGHRFPGDVLVVA